MRAIVYRSFAVAGLLLAIPAAAQIQPLTQPGLTTTIQKPPSPSFTGTIPTVVYAPKMGKIVDIPIATTGGTRNVTMSIDTSVPNSSLFQIVDAPTTSSVSGMQLASGAQLATSPTPINGAAPDVHKLIRWPGRRIFESRPFDLPLTVIATDAEGRQARVQITIKFTNATTTPTYEVRSMAGHSAARYTDRPDVRPVSRIQLSQFANTLPSFDATDPGSSVLCEYGTFRYVCDAEQQGSSSVDVTVPDLGRGKSVTLVLINPYGQQRVPVTLINAELVHTQTESSGSKSLLPHTSEVKVKPRFPYSISSFDKFGLAYALSSTPSNCGKIYYRWNKVEYGSVQKLIDAGPLPAATRVRLPAAGSILSELNMPVFEFDYGASLQSSFIKWDVTYRATALLGECAGNRR